jgi:hypothetical protein
MKKLLLTLAFAGLVALGATTVSAQVAPKSVIHVITVSWKAGTTPEQIKAALDGVQALPAQFKGITHVWTKSIKVQGGKANAIVMEFVNEAALESLFWRRSPEGMV